MWVLGSAQSVMWVLVGGRERGAWVGAAESMLQGNSAPGRCGGPSRGSGMGQDAQGQAVGKLCAAKGDRAGQAHMSLPDWLSRRAIPCWSHHPGPVANRGIPRRMGVHSC